MTRPALGTKDDKETIDNDTQIETTTLFSVHDYDEAWKQNNDNL